MSQSENLAIDGFDPVSYFTNDAPVQGSADYQSDYLGRTYYFANAENKVTFEGNPAEYAPQYGGFCAVAMSEGSEVPVDPNTFDLRDGKLYFFYNKDGVNTKEQWEGNEANLINAADEQFAPVS